MSQNVTVTNTPDPLLDYRVGKLEEAVAVLSEALHQLSDGVADITYTMRSARLAVIVLFGFIQPCVLAVVIHFLTR